MSGDRTFVSLVNVIKDYDNPTEAVGVSAMDLDLAPISANLQPLTYVTNLEDIFLVNTGDQIILYSELHPMNPSPTSISDHLFNYNDGNTKTAE